VCIGQYQILIVGIKLISLLGILRCDATKALKLNSRIALFELLMDMD
jgi:hypothetical protein